MCKCNKNTLSEEPVHNKDPAELSRLSSASLEDKSVKNSNNNIKKERKEKEHKPLTWEEVRAKKKVHSKQKMFENTKKFDCEYYTDCSRNKRKLLKNNDLQKLCPIKNKNNRKRIRSMPGELKCLIFPIDKSTLTHPTNNFPTNKFDVLDNVYKMSTCPVDLLPSMDAHGNLFYYCPIRHDEYQKFTDYQVATNLGKMFEPNFGQTEKKVGTNKKTKSKSKIGSKSKQGKSKLEQSRSKFDQSVTKVRQSGETPSKCDENKVDCEKLKDKLNQIDLKTDKTGTRIDQTPFNLDESKSEFENSGSKLNHDKFAQTVLDEIGLKYDKTPSKLDQSEREFEYSGSKMNHGKFDQSGIELNKNQNKFDESGSDFRNSDSELNYGNSKFDQTGFDKSGTNFDPKPSKFDQRGSEYENYGSKFKHGNSKFDQIGFDQSGVKLNHIPYKFDERGSVYVHSDSKLSQDDSKFDKNGFDQTGTKFGQTGIDLSGPEFDHSGSILDQGNLKFERTEFDQSGTKFDETPSKFDLSESDVVNIGTKSDQGRIEHISGWKSKEPTKFEKKVFLKSKLDKSSSNPDFVESNLIKCTCPLTNQYVNRIKCYCPNTNLRIEKDDIKPNLESVPIIRSFKTPRKSKCCSPNNVFNQNDLQISYFCPIHHKTETIVLNKNNYGVNNEFLSNYFCPLRNEFNIIKNKRSDPIFHDSTKFNEKMYLICPVRNRFSKFRRRRYSRVRRKVNPQNYLVCPIKNENILKRNVARSQQVKTRLTSARRKLNTDNDYQNIKDSYRQLLKHKMKYKKEKSRNNKINEVVKQDCNDEQEESVKYGKHISNGKEKLKEKCISFLQNINKRLLKLYHENSLAQWNFETNISNATKRELKDSSHIFSRTVRAVWKEVTEFKNVHSCDFISKSVARQFKILLSPGISALTAQEYEMLQNTVHEMETIYSTATICRSPDDEKCHMKLEPDIERVMAHSCDPEELKYIWVAWRNATGQKMKGLFENFVNIMNNAAMLNGFKDASQDWLASYEDPYFEKKIEVLWKKVRPLYLQLHAYVRRKLRKFYGKYIISKNDTIPAHLLGNVWAQTWTNIYRKTRPYPNTKLPDVTKLLRNKHYTPLKMFKEAENFFVSINLTAMTEEFWNNSIIEENGRHIVCHASAWDMYDGKDFRIKMCTQVNAEDFIIIHHEMGHVEYYLQYKDLPVVFREGANPGFHEAIGDTISLSVLTLNHIRRIHLSSKSCEESLKQKEEEDINFLYMMALQKIAFIPYAFVVYNWQLSVFRGDINNYNYNKHWWKLRKSVQGLEPPVRRCSNDFDPGAKFHIAAGVEYLRYFVSYIIQFQFHEALCKEAGLQNQPLHQCDIYGNTCAGNKLKKMLQMGYSEPWPEAMKVLTGSRKMSSKSILKYFDPLYHWLKRENKKYNERVGWDDSDS